MLPAVAVAANEPRTDLRSLSALSDVGRALASGAELRASLERALEKQGVGPFFNGAKYSLVDAAYAPFLQRYVFLDRVKPLGTIEKFPRLKAWTDVLMARPSTHSFPEAEFEALYRANLKRRKVWASQFIADPAIAAE